jgi:phosphoglycolate phosphatase-like HAD superfamily hydrolase
MSKRGMAAPVIALAGLLAWACVAPSDPLPSWNDGPTKQSITDFVERVTNPSSPDFVPEPERIAVFDNDGTLWAEQPLYFQLLFALDRVRALADERPEWRGRQPFQAILDDDRDALAQLSLHDVVQVVLATHSGMTTDEFADHVANWLDTARHPRFDRPFNDLTYQPMLELLAYLRANGFKTYIVSGGGMDFIRVFSEETYGIPPEQVIGSMGRTAFEVWDEGPVLVKRPEIDFVDDGAGKPVGIHRFVGRRPIAAFGNSDGDLQMLQYTAAGKGPTLKVLLHHDDAEREWAYDRESPIGHLDTALDEARQSDWTVISMQRDWSRVFPFED